MLRRGNGPFRESGSTDEPGASSVAVVFDGYDPVAGEYEMRLDRLIRADLQAATLGGGLLFGIHQSAILPVTFE